MKKSTNNLRRIEGDKTIRTICFLALVFWMASLKGNAQTTQTFTANGNFIVPAGVTTVQVQAWGGGGAGGGVIGASASTRAGGGGSGGTYTNTTTVSVAAMTSVPFTIGLGGVGVSGADGGSGGTSTFSSTIPVTAIGGGGGKLGANSPTNGAGGGTATGLTFNGGTGAAAAGGNSGAGGGGAGNGPSGNGGNASGTTAGAAGTGTITGGTGATGLTGSGNGNNAIALSGGGSGGRSNNNTNRTGGNGFRGQILVTYTCPTYALTEVTTATGPFCGASTSVVTLRSSTMPTGSYTVTYNLSGSTTATGNTASISFTAGSPGTSTFTTTSLNAGNTTITITNITSGGCISTLSANNTASVVINAPVTAVAGTAITTCSTSGAINITAGASATNTAGVLWTSNGTGTFTNPTSLTLCTYEPSVADIAAGSRTLTLTATGNSPCTNAVSTKTITINSSPTVEAGTDISTCSTSGAINITDGASATNQASVTWTRSGTGTLTNATSLTNCTYTPSAADIAAGTVTLTLTANPNAGCSSVLDTKTIIITTAPSANAGTNILTCATVTGALAITAGATATNMSGIQWTSNGTGTFTNDNSLTLCTYEPSSGDILSGSVVFTLTAFANSPCSNATATKTLTISSPPTTSTTTICQGATGNLISSLPCAIASTGVTGSTNSGTGVNNAAVGSIAWTNPGNITTSGTPYATIPTVAIATTTNYLQGSNYGFSIPANAIIDGITLVIRRQTSGTTSPLLQDDRVSLVKNGLIQPINKAQINVNWSASLGTATYGGVADNWGIAWTAADINDPTFGVVLSAVNPNTSFNRTATVDYMRITVNYSIPGTLNWYTVSSGGSPIGPGSAFNPVGVAGSGLIHTNTPGTTTFYAACSTNPECRTATDFVINANTSYYRDADNDGFGNPSNIQINCTGSIPFGYVLDNTDCNDSNPGLHQTFPFYLDTDKDGFGVGSLVLVCALDADTPPIGYALNNTDCDNTDNTIYQNATFFIDADADGYDAGTSIVCYGTTTPLGYALTTNGTDCDDTNASLNVTYPFYTDADLDGFGAGSLTAACALNATTPPSGFSLNNTDCDDGNASVYQLGDFYVDADNDGYYNGNPTFTTVCYGATFPSGYTTNIIGADCDDNNPEVNPNHVEVLNNGIDDNCSGPEDDTLTIPMSSIALPMCGSTLSSMYQTIYANQVSGAEGYKFEVANGVTIRTYDSPTSTFSFSQLSGTNLYATAYTIRVAVKMGGFYRAYGAACIINTSLVPNTTNVLASQCGTTLSNFANTIYVYHVPGASKYRFRVNDGVNPSRTYESNVNRFNLLNLSGSNTYGTTYSIDVALRFGTTWQTQYGETCSITTPATPPTTRVITSLCSRSINNLWTTIYALPSSDALSYRFEVVNGAQTRFFDTPNPRFSLMQLSGGAAANTVYTIRVAIFYGGIYQSFGPACTITTTPAATRGAATDLAIFEVNAYPNPFANTFQLDINTSSDATVAIKVYDMIGRLVEQRNVIVTELGSQEVGSNYPTGVYNIVMTQGENVKTLRVIKR